MGNFIFMCHPFLVTYNSEKWLKSVYMEVIAKLKQGYHFFASPCIHVYITIQYNV